MEIYYKRRLSGEIIGLIIDGVSHPNYLEMEITDNTPEELIDMIKKIKEAKDTIKDDPTLLDRAKNLKLKEIEINYQSKISEPFTYSGNIFEADDKSVDILNKVIVALPDDGSTMWRTADNKMINVTRQELMELAQGILQRNQQYFLKRCELKDKLNSLDNLEDIKNFDTTI